ncbi:hypothetical protein MLD38_031972 [Melastoma candidum]|uniref:Uncharacterized protein n=1 Tax=Melastoma candidum TaxID=119954 RepID=A0ACB9MRB6_9MYRT|nr:hypothetical protein MLD38_031972 [Melastoma candidum]
MATAAFVGTTQKCKACEKTVYLVDQLAADNKVHHKACFRCHHCKNTLKVNREPRPLTSSLRILILLDVVVDW